MIKQIALVLIFLGLIWSSFLVQNKNKTNESSIYQDEKTGIIFYPPTNLVLQKNNSGDLMVRLDSNTPNITGFQGRISFVKEVGNFNFVNPFDRGNGFFFDKQMAKWRYFGRDGESDPWRFVIGKTSNNDNIYLFSIGDAGGLEQDYIVTSNDNSSLIRLIMGTDEQPGIDQEFGTNSTARDAQKNKLKGQFLGMAKSVIFPSQNKK